MRTCTKFSCRLDIAVVIIIGVVHMANSLLADKLFIALADIIYFVEFAKNKNTIESARKY